MSSVTQAPVGMAGRLAEELEIQRERLMPCVHCGFCLPACPTYNRLGDENDRAVTHKFNTGGKLDHYPDWLREATDRYHDLRKPIEAALQKFAVDM